MLNNVPAFVFDGEKKRIFISSNSGNLPTGPLLRSSLGLVPATPGRYPAIDPL